MKTQFQNIGYFLEYLVDGKLIGTKLIDTPDRDEVGYYGKKVEIAENDIVFKNKKRIKKGTTFYTRMYPLCGKKL